MSENILIGRENELALIESLIDNKRNIIIFGDEGVGKSAIIQCILAKYETNTFLFSGDSRNFKDSLINLIASSQSYPANIRGKNILSLKKILYTRLDKNPEYIILDHIGRVKPKFCSLLAYLIERKIPLLVVSRGLDKQNIGHLRMVLYAFEKVEIKTFDKTVSNHLIDYFMKEFGIKVTKEAEFKRAIFDHSKGNPKIIKALCFLARNAKYKREGSPNVQLMDLDRKINEAVVK